MYPPPDNKGPGSMLGWSTAEQRLGVKSLVVMRTVGTGRTRRPVLCQGSVERKPLQRFLRYSAYLLTVLSSSDLAIVKGSLFAALATIIWLFNAPHHALQFVSLCMCEMCTSLWVCAYVVCVFKRHQQPTRFLPAGLLVKGLNKLWERDWDGYQGKRTEGSQHYHFALLNGTTMVCGPLFSIFLRVNSQPRLLISIFTHSHHLSFVCSAPLFTSCLTSTLRLSVWVFLLEVQQES